MGNKGYFLTFWLYFWEEIIKSSLTYKILHGLYGFLSRQWETSRITNIFRKEYVTEGTARSSIWGKICFSPFLFIEGIQHKKREWITSQKEKSRIVRIFNYLLHNILALNLRFLGVLAVSFSTTLFAGLALTGGKLTFPIILAVFGTVLCFFDINLTELLSESLAVKFAECAIDTKFSFNFFYLTKCGGRPRLVTAAVFGILAGIIATKLSLFFGIAFIGGLFLFALILYKVEFGVYATLFLAPILPTMAVVGLALLCFLSLIIKALTTKKFTFRTEGIGLLVIMMLIVYLISTLTSFAPLSSAKIWAVYFAFLSFYFVVINTIKTKKQLFDLLKVFALSGVLVCLLGIMQYLFGATMTQSWMDADMFSDIKLRIYSTLENPNVLGEYILLALPVSVALMWSTKKIFSKLVFAGFTGIMAVALILTYSRGCWLGLMASAVIFVTFVAGKLWGLALIAIPALPFIIPDSILNRFTSIGDMSDSSTSYRVAIWLGTILMLKDFWVSGVGLGPDAFTQVYPFYSYNLVLAQHPHNLFLHIITESGVVGIFVFLLLLFMVIKRLIRGHQYLGKGNKISVALVAIGAALIGFLVQGMFDNSFYNYRVFMIFWAVIAIGIAACRIAENESNALKEKDPKDA